MPLRIKRIFDEASSEDGYRVLVDRIWPRGVSKQRASLDEWVKDVAPTTELRKWFGHEKPKWDEFKKRYESELDQNPEVDTLRKALKEHDVVTLIYSAHSESENQAVVLRDYLNH